MPPLVLLYEMQRQSLKPIFSLNKHANMFSPLFSFSITTLPSHQNVGLALKAISSKQLFS